MNHLFDEDECRHQLIIDDFKHAMMERPTFINIISVEDLMSLYQSAKTHAQIRCIEQVPVERVMSREIVTVSPTTSLVEAAELMLQHRISGLPVVDETSRLVGVLAEADLLKAVGIPCHHPTRNLWETLESLFLHRTSLQGFQGVVQEHMTAPVIGVELGTILEQAVDLMSKKRIKRLMVVDKAGQLQGVITRSDIIRIFLIQAKQLAG
ncbi:MAG: CBS domain-containing protein [Magnetococcales bacterium]|nr:CBS domain-containing protein [Magnetococcales bacterium]